MAIEKKILNHPDKDHIIKELLNGVSPNVLADWLTERYPNPEDKKYHISYKTISQFRKDFLDLDRTAIRLLKKEKKKKEIELLYNPNAQELPNISGEGDEAHMARVKNALMQSQTYRDRLKEITDAHIDGPRLMKELLSLLNARLETYYNEIASSATIEQALKADKMFAEYIKLANDIIKDSKKVWDEYNEQPDEGNIDLDVVHQMIGMVRDAVKEVLDEIDPIIAMECMSKLNKKFATLKFQIPKAPNALEHIDKINKRIKQIQEFTK